MKPTVFADVNNDMTIAREEIFGPVLCIIPYENEDEAVRIANDTPYGLSGFVTSGNRERAAESPGAFDPATSTLMARGLISLVALEATSSRATAENGVKQGSRNSLN